MNLIKIGSFISEKRKQKELTQQELADMLHLSNRTISKWECGKGIPDSSIMVELCNILEISVNELLAGEHLSNDVYKIKADENIIALINEPKTSYKKNVLSILHNLFVELILVVFIIFCIYLNVMNGANLIDYIDIPALLIVLGTTCIILVITGLHKDFLRSFKFSFNFCDNISREEIEKALYSVKIVMLSSFFSGFILSIASLINIFIITTSNNEGVINVAFSVGLLGILYGGVMCVIMIPILGRLYKIKCQNMKEERL